MSYSENVKMFSYTLFLQGMSMEENARLVKKQFVLPTLKGQTIKKWAETPDASGLTWEDHRIKVRMALQKNVEQAAAGNIAELKNKTKTIHQALYDQLLKKRSQKISSFEGAIYAFKTLSEFMLKLDVTAQREINPLMIVQSLLEIFHGIPEVRKAIEHNWQRIQEDIRIRVSGPDQPIDVTPVKADE